MNRYAVISYNMNPDYIYWAPLVMWSWAKIGWSPACIYVDNPGIKPFNDIVEEYAPRFDKLKVSDIEGYRSGTVAQISRLYAACKLDGLIMTADADMLALSNYWNPDVAEKTVYGFDLTSNTEYPICYVAMTQNRWKEIMSLRGSMDECIKRDLDSMPNAKSEDFYKFWGVDQQLITERLKPYNPTIINRGQYSNGYAVGRVDRGSWTLSHRTFVDAHLFQQVYHKGREVYFEKTMELLTSIWPEEDFTWFLDYTKEFKTLTGHL